MSNERLKLTSPVGRLVRGSLYDPKTVDSEGNLLVYKSGAKAGQTGRVDYWFHLAIPKGAETQWNQTAWGAEIFKVAQKGFPNGQYNSPHFAWKIIDGDSQIPNSNQKKPCDSEGYPGHWILNLSRPVAPIIYDRGGLHVIPEKDAVLPGDYIQVYFEVLPNGSSQSPGLYLNHIYVSLRAPGDRITFMPPASTVGFGEAPLPVGVSEQAPGYIAPVTPMTSGPSMPVQPAPLPQPVQPYTQILQPQNVVPPLPVAPPPAPIAPVGRVMLPAAAGYTYEQLQTMGYTDQMMIERGYMQA